MKKRGLIKNELGTGFGSLLILFAVINMVIFTAVSHGVYNTNVNKESNMNIVTEPEEILFIDESTNYSEITNESYEWYTPVLTVFGSIYDTARALIGAAFNAVKSGFGVIYNATGMSFFIEGAQAAINFLGLNVPMISNMGTYGEMYRYVVWGCLIIGLVDIIWIG